VDLLLESLSLFSNNKDIASVLHFSFVVLQKYNQSGSLSLLLLLLDTSISFFGGGGDILGQRTFFGGEAATLLYNMDHRLRIRILRI